MRKCSIFLSTPGDPFYREMFDRAIKPLRGEFLDVYSFFDRPPVGEFSKEIHVHIAFSNVVLAIIKDAKANVLYEIGLAVGNGKPIIPITDDVDKIPSMLNNIGAIIYNHNAPNWEKLTDDIFQRCMKILTGEYTELRRRTHIELLLKNSPSRPKEMVTSSRKRNLSGDTLAKAINAYKNEKYTQVIKLLEPMIEKGLADSTAFFYLSDAYFLSGENMPEGERKNTYYRKQLDIALQGNELFGDHRDIHKNLGLAYLKLRHLGKAQAVFQALVEKHPNYDVAYYNLACVCAQRGDLLPCVENLLKIIDKDTSWRSLARVDPDFDPFWQNALFQRLLFPLPKLR